MNFFLWAIQNKSMPLHYLRMDSSQSCS
uniref:Uncharacterized protein n=1 Tax=Rhizophora mucronata TaxID=61149 RepID=A0A2P2Q6G8_RHIMU